MENIGHPLPLHERYGHTKRKFILKIRVGTYKFTCKDMEIPHIGRYGGLIGTTWFKEFGCTSSIPAWYKERLANRLRSNQPKNENDHKHALNITSAE